ncbi:MAG: stage V sporulation protein AB [Roseburia sp.]|nr:stage V sporulation protein AB [Roseburia sp.]
MIGKTLFIGLMGVSFGLMVSAGVFTVLFVVGLVPRFAGRTNTAKYELLYEECIVAGSVLAGVLSVFPIQGSIGQFLTGVSVKGAVLITLLILIGVFAGIFVGCLSIALAEVLDGLPIFARRIRLKKGLSIAVLAIALGKIAGSLIYFMMGFFELME